MENLIILAAIAFGGWCTAIASKSHPNRSFSRNLVFQPARFLFPLRLPCEVSRLSRLITNFLRKPKFSVPSPLRIRLASSPKTTSRTQCMLSIDQCLRSEDANSLTLGSRLLM